MSIQDCKFKLEQVRQIPSPVQQYEIDSDDFLYESMIILNDLFDLFKKFQVSNWNIFSVNQIDSLNQSLTQLFELHENYKNLASRSPLENSFAGRRFEFIAEVETNKNKIINEIAPLISFAGQMNNPTDRIENSIKNSFADIQSQMDSTLGKITQTNKDADDFLNQAKKNADAIVDNANSELEKVIGEIRIAATLNEVSKQADYFKNECINHQKISKYWLVATTILVFIFLFLAIGGFFIPYLIHTHFADFKFEAYEWISTKILIFFILGSMVVMSVKNYNGHKHNEVVNRHRQNALMTYQSLTAGASGKGTQDIVLAHAAACIYSPQESGFSSSKNDSAGSKSVLELFTKSSPQNNV